MTEEGKTYRVRKRIRNGKSWSDSVLDSTFSGENALQEAEKRVLELNENGFLAEVFPKKPAGAEAKAPKHDFKYEPPGIETADPSQSPYVEDDYLKLLIRYRHYAQDGGTDPVSKQKLAEAVAEAAQDGVYFKGVDLKNFDEKILQPCIMWTDGKREVVLVQEVRAGKNEQGYYGHGKKLLNDSESREREREGYEYQFEEWKKKKDNKMRQSNSNRKVLLKFSSIYFKKAQQLVLPAKEANVIGALADNGLMPVDNPINQNFDPNHPIAKRISNLITKLDPQGPVTITIQVGPDLKANILVREKSGPHQQLQSELSNEYREKINMSLTKLVPPEGPLNVPWISF